MGSSKQIPTKQTSTIVLQKRALRFIHFAKPRDYAIPLFINTKIFIYQLTSFSRLGAKLWGEIPTKLRPLSKHKYKFNIRASLLDILETGEIILKMKLKAEPVFL